MQCRSFNICIVWGVEANGHLIQDWQSSGRIGQIPCQTVSFYVADEGQFEMRFLDMLAQVGEENLAFTWKPFATSLCEPGMVEW
jgi:hypothetical protein